MPGRTRKTALVLGGGAARGFAHLGLLEVFEEQGVKFDMIVGTSMGALIGGLYAAGVPLPEIERAVIDIPWKKLIAYFRPRLRGGGMIGGAGIVKALHTLVGDTCIEDFHMPFAAVAADIVTGERVVFTSGSAVTAIRASISIPGTFVPVMLNGRALVDGGLLEPVPVPTARDLGATRVVAANVLDHPAKQGRPGWPSKEVHAHVPCRRRAAESGGWYERVSAFAQRMAVRRRERRRARGRGPWLGSVLWNSMRIQQYALSSYQTLQADVVIEPELGDILSTEFTRGRECVEAGRRAAEAALPAVRALLKA